MSVLPFLSLSVLFFLRIMVARAVAQGPILTYTTLPPSQVELYFFADSTSALLANAADGTVYVTHDEGQTWKEADLPPDKHREVTMHPSDNRYAFLRTMDGNVYMTSDQARSWQSIEPPAPPTSYPFHLVFHPDPGSSGCILINGGRSVRSERWPEYEIGHTDYYVTHDGFFSKPTLLLRDARTCLFARSLEHLADKVHPDLLLCVLTRQAERPRGSSRLLASTDFFQSDKRFIDITLDGTSYEVSDLAFQGKFAIASLKPNDPQDLTPLRAISSDLEHWERLRLPLPKIPYSPMSTFALSKSRLGTFELDHMGRPFTLHVSDNEGNNFVRSLENVVNTGRISGRFEYDRIETDEQSVIIMSVVVDPKEPREGMEKLQSRISFDDGLTWSRIVPSQEDASEAKVPCNPDDRAACSLHFRRPTLTKFLFNLYNDEGAPASNSAESGIIVRVGSIGAYLARCDECDTYMSTDAGRTWKRIMSGPHRFGYANNGSVIVLVRDVGAEATDEVLYSRDSGNSWNVIHLGQKIIPYRLSPSPISTSEKFILIGLVAPKDGRTTNLVTSSLDVLAISLDFSALDENTEGHDSDVLESELVEMREGGEGHAVFVVPTPAATITTEFPTRSRSEL